MIDCLIVDDEAPARRRIRQLLAGESDVRVVGESNRVNEALAMLGALSPQLLFLDIRMPGLTGLDLLTRLEPGTRPYVIFTTAFPTYALRAFDLDALDYLVKPIERERFGVAVEKARRRMLSSAVARAQPVGEPVSAYPVARFEDGPGTHGGRVGVHVGRATHIIELSRVIRIVAEGDYLRIHFKDGQQLKARDRMHVMETQLTAHGFVRINRSTLINETYIATIEPSGRGELEIRLGDGTLLLSGAHFHDCIVAWLERLRRPPTAAPVRNLHHDDPT